MRHYRGAGRLRCSLGDKGEVTWPGTHLAAADTGGPDRGPRGPGQPRRRIASCSAQTRRAPPSWAFRPALTGVSASYIWPLDDVAGEQIPLEAFTRADIWAISPTRRIDDSANGYANSKWAGEVLLREAHEQCGPAVDGLPLVT